MTILRKCEVLPLTLAGASVWIDVDLNATPNNPVVIVGAPMKKQDNPTEFVISAIKSTHTSLWRPHVNNANSLYTFNHVFMCNDCQLHVGDRVVFSGTMPTCVPAQSGTLGGRAGVSLNVIYYVVGIVRKYSPEDAFLPEGFQIAYTYQGANVAHPNELNGQSGGSNTIVNSTNTGIVTVGDCSDKTALTSSSDGYGNFTAVSLGCECSTSNALKMKIVRVNSAGGAYVWEKSGGVWIFRSRLSIPGPFAPLTSNVLWDKSYFGMKHKFLTHTSTLLRFCLHAEF